MIDANCQLYSTGAGRRVDSGARSAAPVRQWGAILVLALQAFRGSALQYTGAQYVPELRRCKGVQNSPSFQRSLTWPTIAGFCNVCPKTL